MNPLRLLGLGLAGFTLLLVLLVGTAAAGMLTLFGGAGSAPPPGAAATARVPAAMLALYQEAATTCPGLPWTVLAAIGTVESGNGTSDLPGVHSGANGAGAEGPMQFEPATFAAYDEPVPPGGAVPPNPYDPTDAVYAAARMLCADGASDGVNLTAAVYAYNHSDAYVTQVLALAQSYGPSAILTVSASRPGALAVDWALTQIGTPYRWGGETPGVAFDCSGLVQAAYRVAGIALPRVAQDQFDAGPPLPPGTPMAPGDLVFFGAGPSDVEHVGIYVGADGADGQAIMVDAPHTGADVREEPFPTTVGAAFGGERYVGATDPAA